MPKVKLKKQDKYEFVYEVSLKVRDINYGGHLGNDSLVSLTHEARLDFLKQMGFDELNLGDGKTGIIMSDLVVNYLDEAFMFDKIRILSHIDEISSYGFRVFHNFIKNDKSIALAETGIVAFDYSSGHIAEIPQVFLEKLKSIMRTTL
jgi:acyl-CoA thioesterase FadM